MRVYHFFMGAPSHIHCDGLGHKVLLLSKESSRNTPMCSTTAGRVDPEPMQEPAEGGVKTAEMCKQTCIKTKRQLSQEEDRSLINE